VGARPKYKREVSKESEGAGRGTRISCKKEGPSPERFYSLAKHDALGGRADTRKNCHKGLLKNGIKKDHIKVGEKGKNLAGAFKPSGGSPSHRNHRFNNGVQEKTWTERKNLDGMAVFQERSTAEKRYHTPRRRVPAARRGRLREEGGDTIFH